MSTQKTVIHTAVLNIILKNNNTELQREGKILSTVTVSF